MEETTFSLKVALHRVELSRADGAEEDDFKTWANTTFKARGRPWQRIWYGPQDAPQERNLCKTSVTNGMDAYYNYTRTSRQVPVSEGALAMGD